MKFILAKKYRGLTILLGCEDEKKCSAAEGGLAFNIVTPELLLLRSRDKPRIVLQQIA